MAWLRNVAWSILSNSICINEHFWTDRCVICQFETCEARLGQGCWSIAPHIEMLLFDLGSLRKSLSFLGLFSLRLCTIRREHYQKHLWDKSTNIIFIVLSTWNERSLCCRIQHRFRNAIHRYIVWCQSSVVYFRRMCWCSGNPRANAYLSKITFK